MTKKEISNEIDMIMNELIDLDPTFKQHEKNLRTLIMKLINERPDTHFDDAFKLELKQRLLSELETLKAKPERHAFFDFFATRRFALIASVAGIVILGGAVAYIAMNRPGGLLGTIKPKSVDEKVSALQITNDDQFTLLASKTDSMGIDPSTTFTFKSKTAIDLKTVTESLRVSPSFEYKIESSDSHSFTFLPKSALNSNAVYTFALAATRTDGSAKDYSWAYQVKNNFKIMGSLPKDKAVNVPLNSGIEISFSTDQYKDPDSYFSIVPKVDGTFKRYMKTLVFVPKSLAEKTIYTVTVKKGLGVQNSKETLDSDYSFQFETSSQDQTQNYLSVERQMYEFTTKETPTISFTTSSGGGTTIHVTAYKFPSFDQFVKDVRQNWKMYYWSNFANHSTYSTEGLSQVLSFDAKLETTGQSYLTYAQFPSTIGVGHYLVVTQYGSISDHTYVQVSNLSAVLQAGKSNSFLWAHSTIDGKPLIGATVAYSEDETFSQKTDGSGIAAFTSPEVLKNISDKDSTSFFTISSNDNQLLIPASVYSNDMYYGFMRNQTGSIDYWAYLYTNRSLYAPTDTIRTWGVIKQRNGGQIQSVELSLIKTDYYGIDSHQAVLSSKTTSVSSFNTYQAELPISNLQPGTYTVQLKVGGALISSTIIDVQSYVKPTFKIDITTPKKAIYMGEKAEFDISAKFFDGTPVQNLALKYSGALGSGTVTTDAKGSAVVVLPTTYNADIQNYSYQYFNVTTQTSEITDISAESYIYAFGPRYVIKSTFDEKGLISGAVNNVDLSKINAASDFQWDYTGTPVSGAKTHLKIVHTYYEKVENGQYYDFVNKKTYKSYQYNPKEEIIKELDVTTKADGTFSYQFTPTKGLDYRVDITAKDQVGHDAKTSAYSFSNNFYGYLSDFDSYALRSDKEQANSVTAETYAIGEKVNLQFIHNDTPIPAKQNAFLYYLDTQKLSSINVSSSNSFSFSFEDGFVPNVYAHALYFDGQRYYHSGARTIVFDYSSRKLNIDVTKNKQTYRPGESATLSLHVTDTDKKPVQAEINVSMIDAALAAIQWDSTVSTLTSLYATIPESLVATYETHKEVVRMQNSVEGGGCFSADTQISMGDGTTKAIEDIVVGDVITTRKDAQSADTVSATVIGAIKHRVNEYLEINSSLRVTPIHIVFLNGKWQEIGNAKVGDYLVDEHGKQISIKTIKTLHTPIDVYNLNVREKHTFIANGVYVHNEKGGGRTNFQDIAFFGTTTTDSSGNGTVTFTLPDNVTSWLTTVQGVTKDLKASGMQTDVVATLPFFVDYSLAKTYLVDDKPVIKVRAEGIGLQQNDSVTFTVSYPGLNKKETYTAKAFQSVDVPLPHFNEGEQSITITGTSKSHTDTVTKKTTFVPTYLRKNVTSYATLDETTKIPGTDSSQTTITFANKEQGQFYQQLKSMLWIWGDRLDQRLARSHAQTLLNATFGEKTTPEDVPTTDYQNEDGGIGILPYASSDLLFTAKVLSVQSSAFDVSAARVYFNKVLSNKDSNQDEIVYALYGLASIGDPVLVDIQNYLEADGLKPQYVVYLLEGMAKLGAQEQARVGLVQFLKDHGENQNPYIRIAIGNSEEMTEYTYQAALLAALVGMPEADALYQYAISHPSKLTLHFLDQVQYAAFMLPTLKPGSVSFSYTLQGKTTQVNLSKAEIQTLVVSAEERKSLVFSGITGQVGVTSSYAVPVDLTQEKQDPNVSIQRTYSVNGKSTTTFKDGDIVKITLQPTIKGKAADTSYQVTDYLPSGLSVLSNPFSHGQSYDQLYAHPYEVNGQVAKFWNNSSSLPMYYYALVTSKGEFKADPAQIQGFIVQDSKAYTNLSQVITIK